MTAIHQKPGDQALRGSVGDLNHGLAQISLSLHFPLPLVGARTACRALTLPFLLGAPSLAHVFTCTVPLCMLALRPIRRVFPDLPGPSLVGGPILGPPDSGGALEPPSVFIDCKHTLFLVRISFRGV